MIRVLTFAQIINILIIGIMGAAQNALNHAVVKNGGDRGMSTFCAKSDSKKCRERCKGSETGALVGFEGADFGDLGS